MRVGLRTRVGELFEIKKYAWELSNAFVKIRISIQQFTGYSTECEWNKNQKWDGFMIRTKKSSGIESMYGAIAVRIDYTIHLYVSTM